MSHITLFDTHAADDLARLKRRPSKEPAPTLQEKFEQFHAANPHVYRLLLQYALQAKAKGRGKLGMKCLFERARWYANFESEGDTFKLNNNYTAFYARLLEHNEPQLRGFFEMREQKAA